MTTGIFLIYIISFYIHYVTYHYTRPSGPTEERLAGLVSGTSIRERETSTTRAGDRGVT